MKIEKITITPEDIEVLEEALSCSELSWRDLLTENPEACDEDEVHREIEKIRKLSSDFISVLQDSSSVIMKFLNRPTLKSSFSGCEFKQNHLQAL